MTRKPSPALLSTLCGALLAAASPASGPEVYVAPALVRIHHEGAPDASVRSVRGAGGEIVSRGKGWFDAVVPQDEVRDGVAFLGLGEGDTGEVVELDLDRQLDRFRGQGDAGVYHTYGEVKAEIDALVAARPDLISTESIGETIEGRPIHAVRISGTSEPRPTFLICGLHHAREWISVEVPMGLIHLLVESYDSDPQIKELVDSREVWVVPVLNPDGLEYSQTEYKMWRKNRRPHENGAYGVDLNRNWAYMWGNAGASTNPRSDTYRGEGPFSEPELQALRDLALRERPVAALSFHSYSELVLWPWGYGYDTPPDEEVLARHGRAMAALNGYNRLD